MESVLDKVNDRKRIECRLKYICDGILNTTEISAE
jgi:hypothetical protein